MNGKFNLKGMQVGSGLLLALFANFAHSQNVPEYPAIDREAEVQVVNEDGDLTGPLLPSHRTTNDGRIAIPLTGAAHVYLNVPENLDMPFPKSSAGTEIIARIAPDPARNLPETVDSLRFYNNQILGGANNNHPQGFEVGMRTICLLYTSPSPRDATLSRMPSSA